MSNTKFYFLGFLALMSFDTLAQISFKYAATQTDFDISIAWLLDIFSHPWIYGAFIGYLGSFFSWMTLLKRAPIGPAFAASHLEIVTVTFISIWLFNEALTLPKLIGGLLIIGGVLCLARSEEELEQEAPVESECAEI